MVAYVTATEFRNATNVQAGEYSDTQLGQLLLWATDTIDSLTSRTWQGNVTVTTEYYDGDGTDTLYLRHGDVTSLDALSIDTSVNGTYTTITTTYCLVYQEEGKIVLDWVRNGSIQSDVFTEGNKTVKVSYKYGFSSATNEVKNLCILMVQYRLNPKPALREEINELIKDLAFDEVYGVF